MRVSHRPLALVVVLAFGLLSTPGARALEPGNEHEWQRWPEYCKAKELYETNEGKSSRFLNRVPRSAFDKWKALLDPTFGHVHHYCWAMVAMWRAQVERNKFARHRLLHNAIADARYSYERSKPEHPLYADISILLALAYQQKETPDASINILSELIRYHPDYAPGYSLLSIVLRDLGKRDESLKVLELGNEKTEGRSSEIQYFLGLAYLERDETEKSLEHAKAAYRLGYPLPGLRNRLTQLGAWK